MKTKNLLLLLLFVVTISTLAQHNSSFTLQGHIDGLQKGDTILISEYDVPDWNKKTEDTLIVQQDNYFKKTLPIEHTAYLFLVHIPKIGKPLPSSKRALTFLAQLNDELTLTGNVEYFVLADIKGGFYDNPLVQSENKIEREFNKTGIDIFRKMERARANNQKDSAQFYGEQYNARRMPDQLRKLNDSIAYRIHDSEYAAFQFLRKNYDWNYTDGKERYSRFTPEVKTSYYGKRILDIIEKKKMLEPGETPPDFTFTTSTGKRISLSDYNGKYLLLYWWGMCPGSIQINPYLVDMYKTYHDTGLEIIGITEQDISGFESQVQSDNEEENKKMAVFFNPLWDVVYETEKGNKEMIEPYNFNVLPTVMLISPEGKTLYRGYNDYVGLEKVFLNHLNKK